jgi:hypothetical protein
MQQHKYIQRLCDFRHFQLSLTIFHLSLSFSLSMFPTSASQPPLYTGLGFNDVSFNSQPFGASQSTADLTGSSDPNSPEAFRQNVNLIHQQLARVQALARSAQSGMYVSRTATFHSILEHNQLTTRMLLVRTRTVRESAPSKRPVRSFQYKEIQSPSWSRSSFTQSTWSPCATRCTC